MQVRIGLILFCISAISLTISECKDSESQRINLNPCVASAFI